MSIVTKKGDAGMTRLASGRRVPKSDARVEAYGTLDEVVSFLGLARSVIKDKRLGAEVKKIQGDLFLLGAELAESPRCRGGVPPPPKNVAPRFGGANIGRPKALRYILSRSKDLRYISELHLAHIDSLISRYESKIGRIRCFVVPGDSLPSAALDCARALARRLERKMVALKKAGRFKNTTALRYINRLSDLLWIFARKVKSKKVKGKTKVKASLLLPFAF